MLDAVERPTLREEAARSPREDYPRLPIVGVIGQPKRTESLESPERKDSKGVGMEEPTEAEIECRGVRQQDVKQNEIQCIAMPVRERPPSLSLREGLEKCCRSEEDIIRGVFSEYFENVDEDFLRKCSSDGRTLMLQDLRNKWSIGDVLGIFDELGAEHVDYVFMPLGVWETKKNKIQGCTKKTRHTTRNKSYCFVHFSDLEASKAFAERLSQYPPPTETRSDEADGMTARHMSVSIASTQGIVPNLLRLMDLHNKRWHARAGALVLRLGVTLVPINIAELRKFLLEVFKKEPKDAPACLQKHCTFSFFFGPSTLIPSGGLPLTSGAA